MGLVKKDTSILSRNGLRKIFSNITAQTDPSQIKMNELHMRLALQQAGHIKGRRDENFMKEHFKEDTLAVRMMRHGFVLIASAIKEYEPEDKQTNPRLRVTLGMAASFIEGGFRHLVAEAEGKNAFHVPDRVQSLEIAKNLANYAYSLKK